MKLFSRLCFALLLAGTSYSQVIVDPAFREGRPLAPNSLAVVFGDFSQATPATASSAPLPHLLGGVAVTVDGVAAGIYFVSKTQVNFVIPPGLSASQYPRRVPVQILVNGTSLAGPLTTLIKDISPTLLLLDAGHALRPAGAVNENGALNSEATPATQGETITLYVTGYGQSHAWPSPVGLQTGLRPLVYFRTWAAETLLSRPADGQPGVWQTVVRIPRLSSATSGATPIVVLLDGIQSNTATIWLR